VTNPVTNTGLMVVIVRSVGEINAADPELSVAMLPDTSVDEKK
jgi:hypothetical protein